ncbi:hypothetical protein PVAND_007791 [Polypedilum vanderplanki]|uniref:Cationic amino acid transporter C-terminal domain-containing protein n=1 Tax=Polypedilum vanderplanki TaxID=319348 RepID=A0A9J6C7P5_POLVA|nr:hypothetical protein PVAND_007791 [Polypedilum vanderplanki]
MSRINYWKIMTRRKPMPPQECDDSKLGRVFGTFDLTALGVSATLGVGVYVLAGHVAKIEAGPSVILSFAIAAAASFLAGLCYAEFSSRVPKSGSAYIFTYVAIGEFVAFIIGWNLLLEYIIGSASIAKGLSLYIDSLINNTMKNSFISVAPIALTGNFLSSYFDFFAFACPLLLGFALAFGMRKSAGMNNILCVLNITIVCYVVIVVLLNANLDYWQIDPNLIPIEHQNMTIGAGGFFPFGFSGTLKGASTCFFGFVGYDCIATTGEEVHNPQKSVPRAILFSLLIIFLAYFGVSLLTLMWPYYLLDVDAPLPHALSEIGWETSKWIVTIGGIIALISSLFGAMFPLPRILYAMSLDGLIFEKFGTISVKFKTPVIGTLSAAVLTSLFAGLFDLAALVNMLSIGVLLAYTVVAISIIILRFSSHTTELTVNNGEGYIETSNLLRAGYNVTTKGFFMQLITMNSARQPNTISMTVVGTLIACFCFVSLFLSLQISYGYEAIARGETYAIVLLIVFITLLLLFCLLISIQPRQTFASRTKPFMVPIVPFLPAVSVFINIYLMLMLDYYTWIRFGIWMIIGLLIYFPYAWYHHNHLMNNNETSSLNSSIEVNEKATNDEIHKSNDDVMIVSTCEYGNAATIAHENEKQQQSMRIVINNKLNVDNETHLAIEILDTVLEEEEASDNKKLTSLINEIVPDEKSTLPKLSLKVVIDSSDVQLEIDEILERAVEIVTRQLEQKTAKETVFQNEKFLTHLSDLISSKSNQNEIQSQTLYRNKKKEETEKTDLAQLRHSSSAPNLNEIFRSSTNNAEKDKKVLKNDDESKMEKKSQLVMSPTSDRNTELLEKFAAIKRRKKILMKIPSDTESSEDEGMNKAELREKLEKLLSAPPSRPSSMRPKPVALPRIRAKFEDENPQPAPRRIFKIPTTPQSANMQVHRQMFNEVLRNIKKDENSD